MSSDPLGLEGGLDTYGYAFGNPVIFGDPFGTDANSWTYGEIRSWAITGPRNFSPPSGLPDAKASIGAACTDATCNNVDGSGATAPADRAAWKNIQDATGGTDRTGGGAYMCVGSQGCWFVHRYYTCRENKKVLVERPVPLLPAGTVNVGGRMLYFYKDPLKGWDTAEHYQNGCSCNK